MSREGELSFSNVDMGSRQVQPNLTGQDRLIVALDVPTHKEALALVNQLDNISLFKIGIQLFLTGDVLGLIKEIQDRRHDKGGVFIDLKLSGDIGNTISHLIGACRSLNVKFITLVEAVPNSFTVSTLRVAREAKNEAEHPHMLMVPLLSSLDADDLPCGSDPTSEIITRGEMMLGWGCDGLIVSGDAIGQCRNYFSKREALSKAIIVSPGIRPLWSHADDHKRHTTPREAIRLGSDYLVVGRPIINNENPKGAAARIIEEIDQALGESSRHSS